MAARKSTKSGKSSRPTRSAGANGNAPLPYTVPGVDSRDALKVNQALQGRLHALNDLALTLKHIHWNVVGPHFIGVHLMLDPQVESVRLMVDAVAERMATLGGVPVGTPGALVRDRSWDDYSIERAGVSEHLGALDLVYTGVISSHRDAIELTEELDPVTQDMLIGQAMELEQFQWFVRAHLESADGTLATQGKRSEASAARAAKRAE